MATEFIEETKFNDKSLLRIEQANAIIAEYEKQGFALTLRQLYYQFVARGLLENTTQSYDNLGKLLNKARLAGMVDWEMIEDRTRGVETNAHWSSPRSGIQALRNQYLIDMWANQPSRCEVWIEKEALVGVIEPTCSAWDVPYLACRGYVSASELWRAYRRIRQHAENGVHTTIFHFGDHDPSGIDMTRDNGARLEKFLTCGEDLMLDPLDGMVTVRRLALNMDQIRKYNPPENPAKVTDARYAGYAVKFGNKSWELDALDPKVLANLIVSNVQSCIDTDKWMERKKELDDQRATLDKIIEGLPS